MTDREVRKDLIVTYLNNLRSNGNFADLLFCILEDTSSFKAYDDLDYSRVYRMREFDEAFKEFPPHRIAEIANGKDLDKEYFVHSGFYAPGFKTFNYDEVDKVFPFDKIADAILDSKYSVGVDYIDTVREFALEELRDDVIKAIINTATLDEIVSSFNEFLTETRGCDEQIFRMETDLEEIWFGMMAEDGYFNEQMTTLYEAIRSGVFRITDCYWEMPSNDGHAFKGIRSFNELYDSTNFARLENEYADYLITSKNYEFLPGNTENALDEVFDNYGI
jgi:hypothetical protein